MHIFLTGEIQIGKSTVITKTLSLLETITGGFKTYFGLDREAPEKWLYMNPASEPKNFAPENAVVRLSEGRLPQVLTDKFDTYGVQLIRSARTNANLILMDECGSLERNAFLFQQEVLDTLEGGTPVFGVVKLASNGWVDQIRNHSRVKLVTVTKENRDTLPLLLARHFAETAK
ncbi:MAG: putative nucleotide kinase [Firmicutes bacterium]|nr:putative nucleotide kinase [Bacillota bacterium]